MDEKGRIPVKTLIAAVLIAGLIVACSDDSGTRDENGKPVNPVEMKQPREERIPRDLMAAFMKSVDEMDARLASIPSPYPATLAKAGTAGASH